MMEVDDTYQWKLRAVGAFLDTQSAVFVSLIETRNGFGVRYYQRQTGQEPAFAFIEEPQLRAIGTALRERRRLPEGHAIDGLVLRGPITQQGRYQDLYRALGWELDDLKASSIVMDEQENGVFLSYAYRDPADGSIWRKRVATLDTPEQEEILAAARGRRRMG